MTNFWGSLPHPFLVLAPMENVTDVVFREIVATLLPKPQVLFTEFTSADGLVSAGFDRVVTKLKYTENQRPIVAQVWGNNPSNMLKAGKLVFNLGFDGLDLNMGCPERNLVRKGMCSGLINNPGLVAELISAAKESGLPVSIKTRIGVHKVVTEEWVTHLLKQNIQALTVHGRTASQMSTGEADWKEVGKAVEIRNKLGVKTVIVGNGDVLSLAEAVEKTKVFGVDGVMIGRGLFHNPWIFGEKAGDWKELLIKHVSLFEETWGKSKDFNIMKKFFKMYVNSFDGASELRVKLMGAKNVNEVKLLIKSS